MAAVRVRLETGSGGDAADTLAHVLMCSVHASKSPECRCCSMRSLLLHNPRAGTGVHTEEELLSALRLGGIGSDYCSTKSEGSPQVLDRKVDRFIVAGGDGTIGKVVTQVPDRTHPVAIVPLGSANNVARTFGIAGTPQALAEHAKGYVGDAVIRLPQEVQQAFWSFADARKTSAEPKGLRRKGVAVPRRRYRPRFGLGRSTGDPVDASALPHPIVRPGRSTAQWRRSQTS